MNTYLKPIVNCCNFITRQGYELGKLYGLDNDILNLATHKFRKYLTNRIWLVHGWVVQDP
jgi:hypothetical protein